MHGSRTSAHEQSAAAQARHSRRRHTNPNTLHCPRARSIPAHALGSPRLAVTRTRSDACSSPCSTAAHSNELLDVSMFSAPSSNSIITFCIFCASSSQVNAADTAHAIVSRRAASSSPQPAATSAPPAMRDTHSQRAVTHDRTNFRERHVPNCHVPYTLSGHTGRPKKTAISRRGTGPDPELRPWGWA